MTPSRSRTTVLVAATLALAGVATGIVAAVMWSGAPRAVAVTGDARSGVAAPETAEPTATTAADRVDGATSRAAPSRLSVAALGVDAPVLDLGLTEDGRLEVPTTADDVGWWSGGSAPAEPGPAVLVGHVDWQGRAGVFQRLGELAPGDEVTVETTDGSRHDFVVQRVEQHPKAAFPTDAVYDDTPGPTLRLVTCGGVFDHDAGHYLDNVIVYAVPA